MVILLQLIKYSVCVAYDDDDDDRTMVDVYLCPSSQVAM